MEKLKTAPIKVVKNTSTKFIFVVVTAKDEANKNFTIAIPNTVRYAEKPVMNL